MYLVQELESKLSGGHVAVESFEYISSAMEEFSWPTLEDWRKLKDCHTHGKNLTHDLEVNYKLFTVVNSSHNTRRANIRYTINTDAMKYYFLTVQWNINITCPSSLNTLAFYLGFFVTSCNFRVWHFSSGFLLSLIFLFRVPSFLEFCNLCTVVFPLATIAAGNQ